MKSIFLKTALGAALVTGAAPAFANLIYVNGNQVPGTGLGNVSTVVTVQDNGTGGPRRNGTESGCVTPTAGRDPARPIETCQLSLQGGDNTAGNAGNNTYFLSDIAGLTNAGELGFVVNVSEPGGDSATLTDLYLSLFNTVSSTLTTFSYAGVDMILEDSGGIGQSGMHRFIFDNAQAAQALSFCPVLSQCIVGGGVQFAQGSTQATPETVYVGAFEREGGGNPGGGEVPEPGSLALLGAGTLAFGFMRRRWRAKR